MVVQLNEKGLLDWNDWAEALSMELHRPEAASDGSDYYECWLAALEKLLASKGIVSELQVGSVAEAWRRAAHATPHGSPILLENDPGPGGNTQ